MAQQIRIKTSTGWKLVTEVLLNKGYSVWESVENAYIKTSGGWKNVFSSVDVTNRPRPVLGSGPTLSTNSRLGSGEFTQGSVITVTRGDWQRMSSSYDPVYYHIKIQVSENPLTGIWTTVKESAFSMSVTSLTYTITKGNVNRPSYYFRAIVYAKNKYGQSGETLPTTITTYNPYYLSYKDLNAQFVTQSSVAKSTSIAWSYSGAGITVDDVSKVEVTISSFTDPNFLTPQTYLLTTSKVDQFGVTGNTQPFPGFINVPNYNPGIYNYYLTLWFYAEDTKQDREPTMPREYFNIGPIGNKLPETSDVDISAAGLYGPTTITGTNYNWTNLGSYELNYYFDMATPDPNEMFDFVPDSSTDPAQDSPRWNVVSSGTITNPAAGLSNTKTYLAPDPGLKPAYTNPYTGQTVTDTPQVNYYRFRVVATKLNAQSVTSLSQNPVTVEHQAVPGSLTVTNGTISLSSWSLNIAFGNNTTKAIIQYGTDTNYGTSVTITSSGTFTPVGPLVPGTKYYYRVTPYNINLAGQSVTGDISTSATRPGPASNVSVINTPGRDYDDGQVLISWSAPTYTGGSPIDYYRVQYAYESDNYSTWYTLSDTWTGTAMYAGPWTDGYTIKAKIWSHNAQGYTTESAVSATAAYINTLPEVPTLLTAVKASATSITASFTPNVNYGGTKGTGGSTLTYLLWVTPTDGSSGFSKTITTSPSTITGLTANKEYTVRVRATNDQGYVYSNSITVDMVDRTPVAPALSATLSLQSGSAGRPGSTYRITAPSFTNSPTEYFFDYELNNQGYNSYVSSGWISSNYWDYTFLSETSTSISARVYARNAYATSVGVYASTSVPVLKNKPGAPTITTSSTASSWSIGVTFGTNTSSVTIEYGLDTNYGSSATLTASGTFTPIGPFASNTTYYYRIIPYNVSSPGDSITGSVKTQILLTPPGPARNVSISQTAGRNYDDGQITITWDPPLNNGNATVDYYRVQYAYADANGSYANSTWNTLSDTWASSPLTAGPYMAGLIVKAKVWSHNSQGYTSTSAVSANEVFITTKPEIPTLLTATKASSTSIATTFTPSVDYGGSKGNGGLTTTYELRARNNDNSIVTGKTITTSPSTITGLTSSTNYDVYIAASNSEGTVYSNTIVVPFTPPSLISSPVVTPSSGTQGVTEFATTNGSWTGSPTFTYLWRYRENSTTYPAAPGVNNQATYTPPSNYIGTTLSTTLRCTVTATNAGGSTTANSNDVTVSAPVSPPTGSVSLSPSGTVQARTLITATSSFSNSPTSSYIEIRKATGRTPTQSDTLVASSASTQVTHTITDSEASGTPDRFIAFAYASNSGGTSPTYSSNVITSTPYVPPAVIPTLSSSASWSLVSGTANRVGATYRLNFGSWTGSPTYYTYEISLNNQAGTVLASDSSGTYTNAFVDYTFTSTSSVTVTAFARAGNSAGLSTASNAGSIGPILSNAVAPSGGTVTLTGNATAGSIITASTSGWSGSPTSYSTIITTALSPTIPTASSNQVAAGTTSATYTITSNDTISPVNIFRAFTTASNSAGSASVQSSNYITAQGAIAPFFPPYFVPPFFPPYFVPPFFPPYFVPPYFVAPFFPPYFVPPFFPPYFVPPYFVPPFFPSGCTACNGTNCPELYCFCGGPCDTDCYC
jgi:hypothetical protein